MPDVLRPLFDQVVIKELEPDRMRRSGLLVPQGTHDVPPNEGIVLAVGDGPPDLPDFKMPVKPGDHVVFPRSAGVWVEVEDERLLVCRVREILGVIEAGEPRGSTARRGSCRTRALTSIGASRIPKRASHAAHSRSTAGRSSPNARAPAVNSGATASSCARSAARSRPRSRSSIAEIALSGSLWVSRVAALRARGSSRARPRACPRSVSRVTVRTSSG